MRSILHSLAPRVVLGLLASTLVIASPAPAQVPADEVLKDFQVMGDYDFALAGKVLGNAEIFFSERAVAYLVMAPELESPVLISPRSQAVETVHLMSVLKNADGTVDILADAMLEPVGPFQVSGGEVHFRLNGQEARLQPKPWLLGNHPGERLKEHNPEYAFKASQYVPGGDALEKLRQLDGDVRVRVYFGTWCPVCKRFVPNILRVEEELAGSPIEFEYYGLPKPLSQDPESVRAGIHGVPTVVVYVDGKEVGQLTGHDLATPESSLSGLLGKNVS